MKVCIVGGGNIGTALACYIKHIDDRKRVSLLTNHPRQFSKELKCNDIEQEITYVAELDVVSDDASLVADKADMVFIALPHFAVEKAFENIAPYVADNALIGVLPGGGGCEFFFHKYFKESVTLFGFQRVPFIARLVNYGQEVDLKSWKPYSIVGTLKTELIDKVCQRVESCGLNVKKASNYLAVSLVPTNPVLHTARIYDLFSKYSREHEFTTPFKFYVGWTDTASRVLFSMDEELHRLLEAITEIDTSAIKSLSEHYEVHSVQEMTAKINSIEAFQTIYAPLKKLSGKKTSFVVDTNSRFFLEDFPWGLAIMRSFCKLFDIEAPTMDKVLSWYADFMGLEWYIEGKFIGRDLKNTGIPQRYGIETKEELLFYYMQ